ncbi:MAG: 2-hydroxyacid dehydrogenase [Solirubrobacteraceae bacterium]
MACCFVTRSLPGRALDRLVAEHEVDLWRERLPPTPGQLRQRASRADGLLCLLTDRIDADLIAACPRLRVISNFAVGCDNVDVPAARARGIALGYTPGVLTETTADLAFALILAIARRLPEGMAAVAAGEWLSWEPGWLLGRDVHSATLGIVGLGRIGQAVARRARGFGMEILHTRARGGMPLDDLLARSDFVSLHCPLTPLTRHLIAEAQLRAMKPTAYLVNTSRGGVVDQAALERALREGWIAGAGLDVTDPEPLPPDHSLLGAPNLIVVPHVGSATHATRERMADLAVDNLLAGLAGRPMPHEYRGS